MIYHVQTNTDNVSSLYAAITEAISMASEFSGRVYLTHVNQLSFANPTTMHAFTKLGELPNFKRRERTVRKRGVEVVFITHSELRKIPLTSRDVCVGVVSGKSTCLTLEAVANEVGCTCILTLLYNAYPDTSRFEDEWVLSSKSILLAST
ncbi:MAG: hypothetical protein V7765_04145 [Oleispira sp.]